jgi:hypothetical protein
MPGGFIQRNKTQNACLELLPFSISKRKKTIQIKI